MDEHTARPVTCLVLILLLCTAAGATEETPFDPWVAVDDLIAAGRREAAIALAGSVDRFDRAALTAYAVAAPEEDPAIRLPLAAAEEAYRDGDAERALEILREVKKAGAGMAALRLHLLRGRLLYDGGEEDPGLHDLTRAREIAAGLGRDPERELRHLDQVFDRVVTMEEFRLLEELARAQIDTAWLIDGPVQVGYAEANLGGVYVELRLPHRAIPLLEQARSRFQALARSLPDEEKRSHAQWALGGVDSALCLARAADGDFPGALDAGEAALAAYRAVGDAADVGFALRILANVHESYGAYDEALSLSREALGILDGASNVEVLAARLAVANALMETGRLKEARSVLGTASQEAEALGSDRAAAVARLNLGEVMEKGGDGPAALTLYRAALEAAAGDPLLEAWARCRIGDALSRRGAERDRAILAEAGRAYAAVDTLDPGLALLVAVGEGEVSLALGDPGAALDRARRAADLLEDMTEGLADAETVQTRGQSDRSRIFALGIRAALNTGSPGAVYEMLERSRARAFLAALGGREALLRALLSKQEAGPLLVARERLVIETRDLHRAWSGGDLDRVREAEGKVGAGRAAYEGILRSIERGSRKLRGVARGEIPGMAEVRSRLAEDEAAVLYALLDEVSLAFVIHRGGARLVTLPAAGEIRTLVEIPGGAGSAGEFDAWIRRLRGALVEPLGLPAAVRRLSVCPDGPLSLLPWPLLAGDGRSAVLVPSTTLLVRRGPEDGGKGKGVVALGDPVYEDRSGDRAYQVYARRAPLPPLSATREEVEAITGPGDVRLLGDDATESALAASLAKGGRISVLHLACHGILDARDPRFSALAITPGGGGDGFLTALEVFGMEIPAELVVLSACDSARDPATTGEGVSGLVRSFLLAGAKQVLASLWPVEDDATRELMIRFHEEWGKGDVRVAEALRRAQRAVASSRPDPRDWGGWVIWGVAD